LENYTDEEVLKKDLAVLNGYFSRDIRIIKGMLHSGNALRHFKCPFWVLYGLKPFSIRLQQRRL
jgi:hypothetical protein